MTTRRVVAVLGRGLVPADEPVIRAHDVAIVLGDGLFETMHVRAGRPWLRDEHLARLRRSAQAVDLVLPGVDELTGLIDLACARWPAEVEGALRLVCGRAERADRIGGADRVDGGPMSAFVTISEVPAASLRARQAGIRVATLPLPVTADARGRAGWPPVGVKSTSYGLSLAAQRWAAGHDVDDVLWVSTDGYALEGPSANLVWLDRNTLRTVPATVTGILPGVTASWLLGNASALGWDAAERMVTPGELCSAEGVWFTSSVRGVAEVRALDGRPLGPSPHSAAVRRLLGLTTTAAATATTAAAATTAATTTTTTTTATTAATATDATGGAATGATAGNR